MADISETTIPINKILEGLTFKVKVSGIGMLKFRLWIATLIIMFVSLVTRLNFDVDVVNGGK